MPEYRLKTLSRIGRSHRILLAIFLVTLPAVNPWVRGDGVGYYAYVRSLLIQGNLNFEQDWLHANDSFQLYRLDPNGKLKAAQYTATGHLENIFSVGPSMLWAPFLIVTHGGVLLLDRFGAQIPADGFSKPYVVTIALATGLYGFLGLLFSFELCRRHFAERWALLATIGIWFASSLPVYMYFNPAWSHAHSAFIVAAFLWYWDRTRGTQTTLQWIILGAIGGVVVDVYYADVIVLLAPALESLYEYYAGLKQPSKSNALGRLAIGNLAFLGAVIVTFLPTPIIRNIIAGRPFSSGYMETPWSWFHPQFLSVLFSSDHGLMSWTPVVIFAVLGLLAVYRTDRQLGAILIAVVLAFYYLICAKPIWDGLSSFGNRFFSPLTSIFVLGLAGTFTALEEFWGVQRARMVAYGGTAILIVWNLAFIFQWGVHLVPARGPVSWREMIHNQFTTVPETFVNKVTQYAFNRRALMDQIEKTDIDQLKKASTRPPQ